MAKRKKAHNVSQYGKDNEGSFAFKIVHIWKKDASNNFWQCMVSQTVFVNPDGSGDFTTINDAVAAAPEKTDISAGYFRVYNEYVSVDSNKHYLMMIGEGIGRTVITGDHNYVDGSSTFDSATFVSYNIITLGDVICFLGHSMLGKGNYLRNTAGPSKYQAVAVRNGADLSTFYKCSFEGYQDTLYTHSLRQFYKECDIYGTIDFIFGNAAVVFQDCNIYLRLPLHGQYNVITAQGKTDLNQNTGTSIHLCSIRAAEELNGTETYLGRPWKEYSTTHHSYYTWNDTDFALDTLYYGEYDNTGPGSDTSSRVTWPGYHVMNEDEANQFTVCNFIQGDEWLPATQGPYTCGLL
ncbi:putative pectinesterase/pectinesterase inhibitor 41 [Quercus suber]|uniref:Pectinesterase n=1 Tax=Quercus suber TaxID=58331 RepID=A0AAW0J6V3_QUESU